MSRAHLTLDGSWAECEDGACSLKFHFPNLTVGDAEALPMHVLLPLLEIMDPPDEHSSNDEQKHWRDERRELHRDYDLPAYIAPNRLSWYQHGMLHRERDLPAAVWGNGMQQWRINGILHRDGDQPALIDEYGNLFWYINGVQHRDGDLPAVIRSYGAQEWYRYGERHRDNGPAIIYPDGTRQYWVHGERLDGFEADQPQATA